MKRIVLTVVLAVCLFVAILLNAFSLEGIWKAAAIAALIGLVILLVNIWVRKPFSFKESLRELIRDVGIGFVVAAVVSVSYEASTRSVAEKEKGVDVIDNLMSSFLGENVWKEMRDEVVRTPVLRRNHVVRISLMRNGTLRNGQVISFPKCRALLHLESGYDLYRLTPENTPATVQQALNFEMWDQQLQLPRFELVRIIDLDRFLQQKERKRYQGETLRKIEDGKGNIKLEGAEAVDLPGPGENKPVRIVSERYEIVSTPGQYSFILPVLTTRLPESEAHTVTVIVEEVPDDISVEVNTFWSGHKFVPSADKKTWTFDGIMLPGQGLSVMLNVPPEKQGSSLNPCG